MDFDETFIALKKFNKSLALDFTIRIALIEWKLEREKKTAETEASKTEAKEFVEKKKKTVKNSPIGLWAFKSCHLRNIKKTLCLSVEKQF